MLSRISVTHARVITKKLFLEVFFLYCRSEFVDFYHSSYSTLSADELALF